jgi:hypothetical protein
MCIWNRAKDKNSLHANHKINQDMESLPAADMPKEGASAQSKATMMLKDDEDVWCVDSPCRHDSKRKQQMRPQGCELA